MDYNGSKFFRLSYLCPNTPNSIQNPSKSTIEKTIQNEHRIRNIRSNIISVSQYYKKINNSKNQLSKILSPNVSNKNPNLTRTKSGYENSFNTTYNPLFIERTSTTPYQQIKNNSNQKIYEHKKFNEESSDNFNQLNFTINNYIPIVDRQFKNIKDKNQTFFIKIDHPNNSRNKVYRSLNLKQTPIKGKEKSKTFFDEVKLNNNIKETEFKENNINKDNSSFLNISNNDINNKTFSKLDLSKFLNDKNSIRLLIKNKGKIRNYKVKREQYILYNNNPTEYNSKIHSNIPFINKNKNMTKDNKFLEKAKIKINNNIRKLKRSNTDLYTPIKQNKSYNYSKLVDKKNNEILKEENNKKNKIIKEKEQMIQTLLKKYEQSKERIKYLEKNLENIKKENDDLYKYKSLYDDKEIELIQIKNDMNKYEIENNNYKTLKYNYDELINKYNKFQELKETEINNLKIEYNNLYIKYTNIKSQLNDFEELKAIKIKYNQLLNQNEKLIDIQNKYNKIKNENDELKIIREKYGKLLQEQKNLILIENKYNDLLEENKELKEIKNESEKILNNKKSSEVNLPKINNISFGGENPII